MSHGGGLTSMRANGEATRPNRSSPVAHARHASEISSWVRATKFHHMKSRSAIGTPPINIARLEPRDSKRHSARPAPKYANAPGRTTVPSTKTDPLATISAYSKVGSRTTDARPDRKSTRLNSSHLG